MGRPLPGSRGDWPFFQELRSRPLGGWKWPASRGHVLGGSKPAKAGMDPIPIKVRNVFGRVHRRSRRKEWLRLKGISEQSPDNCCCPVAPLRQLARGDFPSHPADPFRVGQQAVEGAVNRPGIRSLEHLDAAGCIEGLKTGLGRAEDGAAGPEGFEDGQAETLGAGRLDQEVGPLVPVGEAVVPGGGFVDNVATA